MSDHPLYPRRRGTRAMREREKRQASGYGQWAIGKEVDGRKRTGERL